MHMCMSWHDTTAWFRVHVRRHVLSCMSGCRGLLGWPEETAGWRLPVTPVRSCADFVTQACESPWCNAWKDIPSKAGQSAKPGPSSLLQPRASGANACGSVLGHSLGWPSYQDHSRTVHDDSGQLGARSGSGGNWIPHTNWNGGRRGCLVEDTWTCKLWRCSWGT